MPINLLGSRRFLPLFITQFLGAFNDNVFKNALVILITYRFAQGENAQILVTLSAGLFILPFFLFSATAGQVADKIDRTKITRFIKLAEIALSLIAAAGFYFEHTEFLLLVLFGFGMHSTFFGPIKYALLPQHLKEDELLTGNGLIEAGTFLAILFGTILSGVTVLTENGVGLVSLIMLLTSTVGYMSSRQIPPAPAPQPSLVINYNIIRASWAIIRSDLSHKRVFRSILGISWFWLVGATYLSQFPTYARNVLSGDETVVTLFLTVFSVGIGIGSMLCGKLLKGQISGHLAPWAALGMALFGLDLYAASNVFVASGELLSATQLMEAPGGMRILLDLFALSICGGIYIVPLYAIMQHESDPASRARTIASNNIINALFMVTAAIGTMLMLEAHFSVPHVFLVVSLLNFIAAFYIAKLRCS